MIDDAERLDAALDGRPEATAELTDLVATAVEVAQSLSGWTLSPARRELLYQRATAAAARNDWLRWAARKLDPKSVAAVGGAVAAAVAATVIAVAISRGRRQQRVSRPATAAA